MNGAESKNRAGELKLLEVVSRFFKKSVMFCEQKVSKFQSKSILTSNWTRRGEQKMKLKHYSSQKLVKKDLRPIEKKKNNL